MTFCPFCNEQRPEMVAMRDRMPTRTCDRGHVLTDATPTEVATTVKPPVADRVAPIPANLPAAIRARKRELRKLIKDSQHELAQLERLTRPAQRRATVTPIKRVAQ